MTFTRGTIDQAIYACIIPHLNPNRSSNPNPYPTLNPKPNDDPRSNSLSWKI